MLLYYSGSFIKVNKDIKVEGLNYIDSRLEELKNNEKKNTSDYDSLLKAKEVLANLPKQESLYLGDWNIVFDFNVAATMKLILLVLGLSGIFSNEYTSRVAYLNLSTKRGKTKLNTAKIISALLYGTLVFTLVIVLLSLLTKNILVSFGLPLAIYFLPDMLKLPGTIMNFIYNKLSKKQTIV